jgi:hypothetical protein
MDNQVMRINESTLHEATESTEIKKALVSGYLRSLAIQNRARRLHQKERYTT